MVTALLIIPKVCNNLNPNFEAFSCFEEDILSVGGGGMKVFFLFFIKLHAKQYKFEDVSAIVVNVL